MDNWILDTGSATTPVDIELVDFNYRKPAMIKRLFGIGGGTQEVIAQKVDKILAVRRRSPLLIRIIRSKPGG